MSGHKRATVTISQEEYDRLREAEVHLKALPEPEAEVIQQIHQESQEGLRSNLDWVAYRQQQFGEILQGFNDHLRELEMSTSQVILDHQYQLQQELDQQDILWDEVLQTVDQFSQYFQSEIVSEHQRHQEQLSRFERRLGRLSGDLQRKVEIANDWLVAAEQLCAFVQHNYNHSFFLPGQVEQLAQQLILARENLEAGMPEAVLVAAQRVYMECSQMRVELENLESEWQALYCAAWEEACGVQVLANGNRTIQAVDLDGHLLQVDLDLDFWANGGLTQVYFSLEEIFRRLEDATRRPDLAELRAMIAEHIPAVQFALEDAVFDARVAAINSQLRINIADLVVQAMQEQGFWLEEGSYHGVDMRQSYAAHLKNYEGSEVEVQVTPYGRGLGENELHLKSYDEKIRTEHELLQRWSEINRSLARRGLFVRQPEVIGAVPVMAENRKNASRYTTRSLQKPLQKEG